MKPHLLLLPFLLGVTGSLAQLPEWVDVTQRQQTYSDRVYRTGFYSQSKTKESAEVFTRLKDAAKTELIESIQVSIQSTTTLKTQETKKNFSEIFTSESSSLAEGDLIDLNILTYYDRKKNTAYAFAYIRTEKLVNYHLTLLSTAAENSSQLLTSINGLVSSGQLKEAIQDIFKVRSEIRKVEKSQSILMALGKNNSSDLKTEEANKYRAEVYAHLEKALTDPRLTANNLSTYFSLFYYEGLPKDKKSVIIFPFVYEGFSFKSDLSAQLSQGISDGLSEHNDVQILNSPRADLTIIGSFHETGDYLTVNTTMSETSGQKKVIRSAQGRLSKTSLTNEKINFLPVEIQKLNIIKLTKLDAQPNRFSLRLFDTVNAVVHLKAFVPNGKSQEPANELPVRFAINNSRNSTTVNTNDKGSIEYLINAVRSPLKTQALVAEIDASAYLKMDTSNGEYKRLIRNVVIPRAVVQLTISGNTVKAESSENNLGQRMKLPVLQSGLVDALTKTGFHFTQGPDADYTLMIDAETKEGGALEGLYFTYLDATISLLDNRTRKEVFSNHYQDIKGNGVSFDNAGQRAYVLGLKKIKEDISRYFE